MAQNEYIFAVTRVHMREAALLGRAGYEQLLAAPDYDAALAVLAEKGWDIHNSDPAAVLAARRDECWEFLGQMVEDMTPFDVFLVQNDYHNLKAAIKRTATGSDAQPVFLSKGTVPVEDFLRAAESRDFSRLPEPMARAGAAAWSVMQTSGDGRQCDILLDTAALEALLLAGKASGHPLLARYAELTVAAADIKTAVRCARLQKPQAFVRAALVECQTLSADRLARAATQGEEAVCSYLSGTDYADGVSALRQSTAAFERWCDDRLMEEIRPQKNENFGIGPLAAYILARENELVSVRIILSGQASRLPAGLVRERLREPYV